jgi:hypothetical protein
MPPLADLVMHDQLKTYDEVAKCRPPPARPMSYRHEVNIPNVSGSQQSQATVMDTKRKRDHDGDDWASFMEVEVKTRKLNDVIEEDQYHREGSSDLAAGQYSTSRIATVDLYRLAGKASADTERMSKSSSKSSVGAPGLNDRSCAWVVSETSRTCTIRANLTTAALNVIDDLACFRSLEMRPRRLKDRTGSIIFRHVSDDSENECDPDTLLSRGGRSTTNRISSVGRQLSSYCVGPAAVAAARCFAARVSTVSDGIASCAPRKTHSTGMSSGSDRMAVTFDLDFLRGLAALECGTP